MSDRMQDILTKLRLPFHPSHITWKPGAVKGNRALAMPYADLRAYMNRLDEVCGEEWEVSYEPWGDDRLICRLTIGGVTRCSTGETTNESEKSEIGGTVAEAQSFKRASAMFGLGRYLYQLPTGWADYDPATRKFTEQAKFKLTGVLLQHYRRATDSKLEMAEIHTSDDEDDPAATSGADVPPEIVALLEQFNALGSDLYLAEWEKVCRRNVKRISKDATQNAAELTVYQLQQLITGMMKLKSQRAPTTNGVAA